MDDADRTSAILALTWLYSIMGDFENTERTASSQSPVRICREVLLAGAAEDEKAEGYRGEAIIALLHELYKVIGNAVMIKHSLSHSQAGLDTMLAVAGLYESIFDEGKYGFYHNDMCMIYWRCTSIAAHMNDYDRALNYLETALDHFLAFKQVKGISQFAGPLVNKAKDCNPSIVLLDREWFEESMQSFPADCADAIRNNPRYASIFAP